MMVWGRVHVAMTEEQPLLLRPRVRLGLRRVEVHNVEVYLKGGERWVGGAGETFFSHES